MDIDIKRRDAASTFSNAPGRRHSVTILGEPLSCKHRKSVGIDFSPRRNPSGYFDLIDRARADCIFMTTPTPTTTDGFDKVYQNYWACKKLRAESLPRFAVKRWWDAPGLSEIEQVYFDAVREAPSLLDVGAGDLRVMRKFREAGFQGEYHTQDLGVEFPYDYQDLGEVNRTYQAILCFDVIEHLPLQAGIAMVLRMAGLLGPGGVLVLQTPNSRCINNPLSWDMTHLHCYNLADLWAYLTALGLKTEGYRVTFEPRRPSVTARIRSIFSRYLISRRLNCDYAANIALICTKPG